MASTGARNVYNAYCAFNQYLKNSGLKRLMLKNLFKMSNMHFKSQIYII